MRERVYRSHQAWTAPEALAMGPAYVRGPVTVVGSDIYRLDGNGDGIGCEWLGKARKAAGPSLIVQQGELATGLSRLP
jgi:hypothetical protein